MAGRWRAWPRGALARVVGVVGQQEEAVFRLSVAETVMLGRYARLGPLAAPGAEDRSAVRAALERCDIVGLAERSVDSLSGGEWKRVRVARALAQEPRALVLDEPTASLDVRHEMELFELIRQLVDGGLAGLVITHHLNLAARFAHRILLLDRGVVVAEGTPARGAEPGNPLPGLRMAGGGNHLVRRLTPSGASTCRRKAHR